MLNFSEISINDKLIFDRYLSQYMPQASELTFTNLFMWRNFYKFRFAEIKNYLCILSVSEGKAPFSFIPIGKFEKESFTEVVTELNNYFVKQGWELRFKRVEEKEVDFFKECENLRTDFTYDRDSSDYVYLTDDLINLKGKKYDGKRNHIKKFKREYEFEYVVLNEGLIEECIRIMSEWCAERDCEDHKDFYCEKLANMELLSNFRELGCKGALIRVDGRFEGFTVGEMLNRDTAVIHIEKANSKVKGLYTLINQQFCENEWKEVTFINREQDLGVEGLRKAKLSYKPVKMINKYLVRVI